jgi:type I restriction-modification system DNA methylase subunit
MVALPPQLFFSTAIPVTLWFLHKPKRGAEIDQRVLFVDAKD